MSISEELHYDTLKKYITLVEFCKPNHIVLHMQNNIMLYVRRIRLHYIKRIKLHCVSKITLYS